MNDRRKLRSGRRGGLTLVEMLVALAVTLVMMGSVVTIFNLIGEGIGESRAVMELGDRVRSAANRLQHDLDGITVNLAAGPWTNPGTDAGYFEYVEGWGTDYLPGGVNDVYGWNSGGQLVLAGMVDPASAPGVGQAGAPPFSVVGDLDDQLIFTVRNDARPFHVQLFPNGSGGAPVTVETPYAEVAYWVELEPYYQALVDVQRADPTQSASSVGSNARTAGSAALGQTMSLGQIGPTGVLMRQVRPIVREDALNLLTKGLVQSRRAASNSDAVTWGNPPYVSINDQMRSDRPRRFNTLNDLVKSELRGWRWLATPQPGATPAWSWFAPRRPLWTIRAADAPFLAPYVDERLGTDVVLRGVKAFDVRIWDPNASLIAVDDPSLGQPVVLQPGDPSKAPSRQNYAEALKSGNFSEVGRGAFVDLGWARLWGFNAGDVTTNSSFAFWQPPAGASYPPFYSTWSLHYEADGVDQDGDGLFDEGMDGRDSPPGTSNNSRPVNGVDDPGERETSPPFDAPILGVQVTLRVLERDGGHVRQTTVVTEFVKD